jgi:two-component system CheB/CheR fusion protein
MKADTKKKEKTAEKPEEKIKKFFPITGIGSSAGGLDALKKFFMNMPPSSGSGFVLVQHLDPTHKSSMVELLNRYTSMDVIQVEDGMEVKPNHVYVIPPNKDMAIINGVLQLLKPSEPHGFRTPINFFLKSLAEDQKDNAICIILSGFGVDGTIGLKEIKSEGGMAIAQDPKTTESNSMPISAIKTGIVDFVLPPEEMPKTIVSYIQSSCKIMNKIGNGEVKVEQDLQKIFILIRNRTGHDFSSYKESTMNRRIGKRANIHQIDNIADYALYLQQHPEEIDHLFQELLINVTSFFRDPEAFNSLKFKILPELLMGKDELEAIRLWVPGCSSGEEVYSIAMILREIMESMGKYFEVQIFGTDLDDVAINTARKGVYPDNIIVDVGEKRLKRFFIKKEGKYHIKSEIRELAVFAVHNVLKEPPFTKLDMVSCRNLLIYLKSDAQKNLLSIFNYALNSDGILFLGPSESVGDALDVFTSLDKKWKIFKSNKHTGFPRKHIGSPNLFRSYSGRISENESDLVEKNERIDVSNLATRQLLDIYAPPSVIINDSGEIFYIHGRMGKYLEPAPGKARLNLFDMAREGIKFELRSAIKNAIFNKKDVFLEGLRVKTNGEYNKVNITIRLVKEPEVMRNLLVVSFEDVAKPKKLGEDKIKLSTGSVNENRVSELENELMETKERLNITTEEMETSYEELKASNEELQSMNEESQSTNEELETSKEELQSINEELATVNSELQSKIDELTRANDDLYNLFNSTEIPTIFLDKDLNIRNFTPEASELIKIRKSDLGRPLSDITSNLKYDNFNEDIKLVLHRLIHKEIEIQTKDDNWYLMRITPYKTSEDVIDGVVIIFVDINDRKNAETKVKAALKYSENIVNSLREPILVLNEDLTVYSANQSFYDNFKVNPNETIGVSFFKLDKGQWNIAELRTLIEKILPENTEFNDYKVEKEFADIGYKKMLLNARRIYRGDVGTQFILISIEDLKKN